VLGVGGVDLFCGRGHLQTGEIKGKSREIKGNQGESRETGEIKGNRGIQGEIRNPGETRVSLW
jgi:hypothetical protein